MNTIVIKTTEAKKKASSWDEADIDMQVAVEQILSTLGLLERFRAASRFVVDVSNGRKPALLIEKNGRKIGIIQYGNARGDGANLRLLEMEDNFSFWLPTSLFDGMESCHAFYVDANRERKVINENLRRLITVSKAWARELLNREHGLDRAAIRVAQ